MQRILYFGYKGYEEKEWENIEKYVFNVSPVLNITGFDQSMCIQYAPFGDNPIDGERPLVLGEWAAKYEKKIPFISQCSWTTPNDLKNVTRQSPGFWNLYGQYLEIFRYRDDMNKLEKEWKCIQIKTQILEEIVCYYFNNKSILAIYDNDDWFIKLDNAVKKYGRAFVRTAYKSTKNDVGIKPVENGIQALTLLASSNEILKWISETNDENTYIAVLPWEERINNSNEFRVIIDQGKVKTFCQQHWFVDVGLDHTKIKKYVESTINQIEKLVIKLDYYDVVLDLWIDENDNIHFIEANPGGRWACSHSGLVKWTDNDIWHNDNVVHVRYFYKDKSGEEVE